MHKLTKIALLAAAGGLSVYTPAMAAPPMSAPQLQIYCAVPSHAQDPQCLEGNGGRNGYNNHKPGGKNNTPTSSSSRTDTDSGPHGFNFSTHDRDVFHQRFGSFNFGVFQAPGFNVTLGVAVPHAYKLRTVPGSIARYYPQFRGYLFLRTPHGSIAIVSPKSHRIVAVI